MPTNRTLLPTLPSIPCAKATRKASKRPRSDITRPRHLLDLLLDEMHALDPQVPVSDETLRLLEGFRHEVREGSPFSEAPLPAMEVLDAIQWTSFEDAKAPRASVALLSLLTWITEGLFGSNFEDSVGNKPQPPLSAARLIDMTLRVAPQLGKLLKFEDLGKRERLTFSEEGYARFGRVADVTVKKCKADRFSYSARYWE